MTEDQYFYCKLCDWEDASRVLSPLEVEMAQELQEMQDHDRFMELKERDYESSIDP